MDDDIDLLELLRSRFEIDANCYCDSFERDRDGVYVHHLTNILWSFYMTIERKKIIREMEK